MINTQKTLISVGVGVGDILLEQADLRGVAFMGLKASDLGRYLATAAGYGLQLFGPNNQQALGEALALSATPLVIKAINSQLGLLKATSGVGDYAQRSRTVKAGNWVPSSPSGSSGYRSIS